MGRLLLQCSCPVENDFLGFRLAAAERFQRRETLASRRWTDGREFIHLDGKRCRLGDWPDAGQTVCGVLVYQPAVPDCGDARRKGKGQGTCSFFPNTYLAFFLAFSSASLPMRRISTTLKPKPADITKKTNNPKMKIPVSLIAFIPDG